MGGMSTGGIKNLINKKKEDYWVLKNNKMPFPLWILLAKNISKIPQLIFRKQLTHLPAFGGDKKLICISKGFT
jgi:hypothetical protein